MKADPEAGVLVELLGARRGVVGDAGLHDAPEACALGWGRVGIDDRLHDAPGAEDVGRAERQDVRRAAALGLVRRADGAPARLELRDVVLEDALGDRDQPGRVEGRRA